MKDFKQKGDKVNVVAGGTIASGSVQQVGQMIGVAQNGAVSGETYVLDRKGVFELPKNNTEAWTQGETLYWDGTEVRNASAATRLLIGYAFEARLAADTTGFVVMDGTAREDV